METPREKLKLTAEEAQALIYGDNPNYKVIVDEINDHRRWSVRHRIVIQRISDGRFFADGYSRGATELQDEGPWQYDKPDFNEVFPIEKMVIEYK